MRAPADRLQGEAGSDGTTTTYAYDANGSLTGKQDAAGTSVYSYDGDRRLVDAITPNAGLSYRYDANGIRQSQAVNGVTTRFVVDPTAQYAQVLEERGVAGNVLYLLGDDRIARTQGGTTHYLHTDGLGSTRLLTTSTGQGADRWWYEAFGEVETSTGNSGNAFLFAGEQLDPNLGYYYLRARYMDPSNGRFTQMDLWQGNSVDPVSLHKYAYASVNPINYVDPSGYFTLAETAATSNIRTTLASIQMDIGFTLLDVVIDPENAARNSAIGLGVTALGGAGFRLLKRLSSKFRKSLSGTPLAVCEVGCLQKMGGVEFEAYLNRIGLGHNFEIMGKQFDGFYGGRLVHEASIWIEAKAANYWDNAMETPLKTRNMLSSFGHQQKLAMEYGKEFHLISGGPIPQLVRDWLEERGIRYFEAID